MKKILLTRESVSMADDTFDNTLEIQIQDSWKLTEILEHIKRLHYLPLISGGKATWSVAYYFPVAVIAQEWEKAEIIRYVDFPHSNNQEYEDFDRLHFNYHAQKDPFIVLEVLDGFSTVYEA